MNFECPGCKMSGQIDDSRVPDGGIYATCPQCNTKFLIKRELPKDFIFDPVSTISPEATRPTNSPASTASQNTIRNKLSEGKHNTNDVDIMDYYKAAIGNNFDKYSGAVREYEQNKSNSASWHWPAFLVAPGWMLYRKMYGIFLLYSAATIAINALTAVAPISGLLFLVLGILTPIYAKNLYIKHIANKISAYDHLCYDDKINKLTSECGTNTWVQYLVIIPAIGIIAAVVIPKFNGFVPMFNSENDVNLNGFTKFKKNEKTIVKYKILSKEGSVLTFDLAIIPTDKAFIDEEKDIFSSLNKNIDSLLGTYDQSYDYNKKFEDYKYHIEKATMYCAGKKIVYGETFVYDSKNNIIYSFNPNDFKDTNAKDNNDIDVSGSRLFKKICESN